MSNATLYLATLEDVERGWLMLGFRKNSQGKWKRQSFEEGWQEMVAKTPDAVVEATHRVAVAAVVGKEDE